MKTILIAAASFIIAAPGIASAASSDYLMPRHHHVRANGRCGGISYGTGARRCGTLTGGPVGGLSNRN